MGSNRYQMGINGHQRISTGYQRDIKDSKHLEGQAQKDEAPNQINGNGKSMLIDTFIANRLIVSNYVETKW